MPRDSFLCAMLRSIGMNPIGHKSHERVLHPGKPTYWAGHSLGGHTALEHAKPGDTVLLFDPRQKSVGSYFDSFFRFEMPFTAPKGLVVISFFRRGLFLPGQRVNGGANYELSRFVPHVSVPKAAAMSVKQILGEQ